MSRPAATLFDLFADNLPDRADKTFLIDPDRSWTYGEVAGQVDRVAAFLTLRGVAPGDRVVVQLRKGMREVAAMLAAAQVGAVFVNVSTAWTPEQLAYVVEDSGARALLIEPAAARGLPAEMLDQAIVLLSDRWGALNSLAAPIAPRRDDDLAAIIYTSGSTGKPKGVMLSHRNILTGARSVARYLGLTEDDRLLGLLPYSFDYGLNQLTTMMLKGGTIVHQPVPMPTEIVRAMREHDVTGVAAVPPIWIQLVRLLEQSPIAFPALRRITNSGGAIPTSILEKMPALLPGTRIFLMYGLTEAFRSTYLPPEKFAAKMGSIGQAIPNAEIYVIKHGEGLAGPGEQGELVHCGPLVALGYWNRPQATAEKIRPCPELSHLIGDEPVVYSGDIVRVDADGDLWFVGRNDALIKSSGFRISPEEVEDLVHRAGMATDVVAFGVADDLLGQSVHVAATLLPGATREALMAHCRQTMPAYMVPRTIHVWPNPMPRTASGKLARPDIVRACSARTTSPRP